MKTCLNCKTENPDDARYCQSCRFTLDWEPTRPAAAADITQVLPPPTLELAIGPGQARVTAGGQAVFGVRVVNRGGVPGRVRLSVAGPMAGFTSITPAEAIVEPGAAVDARLTATVPASTPPGTVPIDLYATEAGGSGASIAAQAALTIDPAQQQQQRWEAGPRPRRRWLAPVLIVAALLVAAVLLYTLVWNRGIGGHVETQSGDSACLREDSTGDEESRVDPGSGEGNETGSLCDGLSDGTSIKVRCVDNDFVKLVKPDRGRWISRGLTSLDEDPPDC